MYRDRDFEFISISADDPEKKDKVLKFLQSNRLRITIIFSAWMTNISL